MKLKCDTLLSNFAVSTATCGTTWWALGVCAHVLLTGAMPPFVTSPDGRGVDAAAQLDAMMREVRRCRFRALGYPVGAPVVPRGTPWYPVVFTVDPTLAFRNFQALSGAFSS